MTKVGFIKDSSRFNDEERALRAVLRSQFGVAVFNPLRIAGTTAMQLLNGTTRDRSG